VPQRVYSRPARTRFSRSDFVDNGDGREARYLDPELRRIIWRDTDVRDVLIAAGEDRGAWNTLVAVVGNNRGLALLELVSAMSLQGRLSGAD
jgi:hypothetical protein